MRKEKRVLYLTYDGLGDHIGQSQILPYLTECSRKGIRFHILSFEKAAHKQRADKAGELLSSLGITWYRLDFTQGRNIFYKLYDFLRFVFTAFRICLKNKYSVIHSRSYFASSIGLLMQSLFGSKLIFDKRDFWIDAIVETGRLRPKEPLHKIVHGVLRFFEKKLFRHATHIISLTERAKQIVLEKYPGRRPEEITVIPCCVDLSLFDPEKISDGSVRSLKASLRLENSIVLGYVGSFNPAYMIDELLDCFKVMLGKIPNLKLLFIINNDPDQVFKLASEKNIPTDRMEVTTALREQMPLCISVFDLGFFFIMPSFAKQASSPTKLAEMLAMRRYVITNKGVGDVEEIFSKLNCGYIIEELNQNGYLRAAEFVIEKHDSRGNFDLTTYSLPYGAAKYFEVYQSMLGDKSPARPG
jgi:glycosyltransferase involved in cell wall biosynthesis